MFRGRTLGKPTTPALNGLCFPHMGQATRTLDLPMQRPGLVRCEGGRWLRGNWPEEELGSWLLEVYGQFNRVRVQERHIVH